jgi:Tol biopolymer transport system component
LGSFNPSISSTGRYVTFVSYAANLVAGDTNNLPDVFLRDTCVGATGCTPSTTRISVSSTGAQASGDSRFAIINGNGRYITFHSFAPDLVSGDTNGAGDVFVRDTCIGATGCTPSTIRVSVDTTGAQGNDHSFFSSISGDGRYVAFASQATNLVSGDTNAVRDIYVRDTCIGATGCAPSTTRVSIDSNENQASGESNGSFAPAISADGRYISFVSSANNLVSGDINGMPDIFRRDRVLGTTERISLSGNEDEGNADSRFPSISADGQIVAFHTFATNLVPGDTNNAGDVLVRIPGLGLTDHISVASNGAQGNDHSYTSAISTSGGSVAYQSFATNLVSSDTNLQPDIFVCRRQIAP